MKATYARRRIRRSAGLEAATFKKENQQEQTFFGDAMHDSFFKPAVAVPQAGIQRKCAECEKEEKVQRMAGAKEEEKVQRAPEKKEEEKLQRMPEKKEGEKVQRMAGAKEEEKVQRAPEKKEEEKVQKKDNTVAGTASANTTAGYIGSINGKGQPLSPSLQSFYGNRIGADFSEVKIHTGQEAAQSARDINAQAYAYGNHIVFNEGKYQPETSEGKHLLAHELTHVVQQGHQKLSPKIQRRIGDGHDFPAASPFALNAMLESVFDNTATVSATRNNNGAHVTIIQNALIGRGYQLPRFGADGSFGDETRRAVRAFQQDVGLSVDGVVGFSTIDFLDKRSRGAEVAPPVAPVFANTPFNTANAIVQPGAVPSIPLGGNWGLTFPENVQVSIDVILTGGGWRPVLRGVTGNYSLQNVLLAGVTEVTGPRGNTTAANYCAQITDLDSLALGAAPIAWYMRSAVLAHERVHAEKFRTALIHPSVVGILETAIEAITVPFNLFTVSPFAAELFIRANPAFVAALVAAQANWLTRILALVGGDHGAGGLSLRAERDIVNPMIRSICRHARANGWPACPPLCR